MIGVLAALLAAVVVSAWPAGALAVPAASQACRHYHAPSTTRRRLPPRRAASSRRRRPWTATPPPAGPAPGATRNGSRSTWARPVDLPGRPAPGRTRPTRPRTRSRSPRRHHWTTIYSTTTVAGGTETLSVTGSGRYIRMYGTARASGYGYSLYEFQVFTGTGGTTTTPPPGNWTPVWSDNFAGRPARPRRRPTGSPTPGPLATGRPTGAPARSKR